MLIAQNIVGINTHHREQNQKTHTSTSSAIDVEEHQHLLQNLRVSLKVVYSKMAISHV